MSSSAVGMQTSDSATEMWYNEINDPGYDYNNQGFASGTGHFTQVVWKECTHVGFGIAGGYVVGRYVPHGNMMGAFEQNVPPLVAGWEEMKAADDKIKADKKAAEKDANKPKTKEEFMAAKPDFDYPEGCNGAGWSTSISMQGNVTIKKHTITFKFKDGHEEKKEMEERWED